MFWFKRFKKRGEKVSASLRSFHLLPSFPWMKKNFFLSFPNSGFTSSFLSLFFLCFLSSFFLTHKERSKNHSLKLFILHFVFHSVPSISLSFGVIRIPKRQIVLQNRTQFKLTYAIFELSSSYRFHS